MKQETKQRLYEAKKKNPALAACLSLLIVGAGQMYNEEYGLGIAMFFGCIVSWFVLMGWVFWIAAPMQAYKSANNKNLALRIELGLEE